MGHALTLEDLVARTGKRRDVLADVLGGEVRAGRVRLEGGRYVLNPGALDADLVDAFELLAEVSGRQTFGHRLAR